MWEITEEEVGTLSIELLTIIAAASVLIVILYLKKEYPKLTKEGFVEFTLGVLVLIGHFTFDFLDTLAESGSILDSTFDMLDAIFAFTGLFIIGFAFFKIAKYGMVLWEGVE